MFTALISTVAGLISGTVPNLLKEWGASREHKRELEMLTIQTDLQLKIADKQGETRVAKMAVRLTLQRMSHKPRLHQLV